MLEEKVIATFEEILQHTRNSQSRVLGSLREAENTVEMLRQEYEALENKAVHTEQMINEVLLSMRTGGRAPKITMPIGIDDNGAASVRENPSPQTARPVAPKFEDDSSVRYFTPNRGIPKIANNVEPISIRFSDRTITQACTLLLSEARGPLHVNELYNALVSGGFKFKGHNPTISIAVSLNRNKRFRKVDPGTFDLVMREVKQIAS